MELHNQCCGSRAISFQEAANDPPNFFFGKAQSKQGRVPAFGEGPATIIAFIEVLVRTRSIFFPERDVSCSNDPEHLTILVRTGEFLGFSFKCFFFGTPLERSRPNW